MSPQQGGGGNHVRNLCFHLLGALVAHLPATYAKNYELAIRKS